MKIPDIKEVGGLTDVAAVRPTRPVAAQQDKVSVTQTPGVQAALDTAKASAGMSRTGRLREIEQAVKSGRYQPNAQAIANQILDDAELNARLQAMLK